jgi:hypothetical protein
MQKKEYVDNFESNAAHMMQAITQLLSDCLSEKERQIETQNRQPKGQRREKFFPIDFILFSKSNSRALYRSIKRS